jgi:hypothetical protein
LVTRLQLTNGNIPNMYEQIDNSKTISQCPGYY